MQSINNQTYVPLRAGAIFIGQYEDVLDYQSADYTIKASTNSQVVFYQSNDKIYYSTTNYDYTSGQSVTQSVALNQRYFYITVRNTSNVDQTLLQFTMIYKPTSSGGDVMVSNFPSNYPIVDSDGNSLGSVTGSLQVVDTNMSYTGSNLNVQISGYPESNLNSNMFDSAGNALSSVSGSLEVVDTNLSFTGADLNVVDTVAEGYLNTLANTGVNVTNNHFAVVNATASTLAVSQSTAASLKATVNLNDGSGNPINSTTNSLNVNVAGGNIGVTASILPTGASTSALQSTGNGYLSTLASHSLAAGQAVMASSSPVVIASDQSAINVDVQSTVLAVDASTSSLQVNGNGFLSTLATNSLAPGQAFMASSAPVVIASDQSNINVNLFDASGNGINSYQNSLFVSDQTAEDLLDTLVVTGINVTNASLTVNVQNTTNTGGTLWNSATVANGDTSAVVNMTGVIKNVYTFMGSSSDQAVLTLQYSADGVTFYNSQTIITITPGATFALDIQTSAGYVQFQASGIMTTSTITAFVNHV